jgi:hypothetical protein
MLSSSDTTPAAQSEGATVDAREESVVGGMLRERSRRTTITSVLDRLLENGGEFAEQRRDGSAWSARIPGRPEHGGAIQ